MGTVENPLFLPGTYGRILTVMTLALLWLLYGLLYPAAHSFLRGHPPGKGGVYLYCEACDKARWYPKRPPDRNAAWICNNRARHKEPQERVLVYPHG
jgi:hypothetical protein